MVGEVLLMMRSVAKDGMTMICMTHKTGFARDDLQAYSAGLNTLQEAAQSGDEARGQDSVCVDAAGSATRKAAPSG